jgi:hypothetical protein
MSEFDRTQRRADIDSFPNWVESALLVLLTIPIHTNCARNDSHIYHESIPFSTAKSRLCPHHDDDDDSRNNNNNNETRHPKRLVFPIRPDPRLEATFKKTPKPSRAPVSAARHPRRRILLHPLDDFAAFPDSPHARRHQPSAVERFCTHERGRGG